MNHLIDDSENKCLKMFIWNVVYKSNILELRWSFLLFLIFFFLESIQLVTLFSPEAMLLYVCLGEVKNLFVC